MPTTPLNHFDQDVARARAIVAHADPLPAATGAERALRSDLLRAAWMFAVGAIDAYFCDAYTDVVAATIIAKQRHPAATLPDFFGRLRFPVAAILAPYASRENWRWRMAARQMMERENVLSLDTVQRLFNPFLPKGSRFFGDLLPAWIAHPGATPRLFGTTAGRFAAASGAVRSTAVAAALDQMTARYRGLFQRRHDCIHNCDRPRVAPQPLEVAGTVAKVSADAEFLVRRCDEHLTAHMRPFLLGLGCPLAVVAQVGY